VSPEPRVCFSPLQTGDLLGGVYGLLPIGSGRIVVSETEAPNMLASLV
jgi:hypothetical protein